MLDVINTRKLQKQPLLAVISANGVLDEGPRDYPLPLTPLYRWMLCGIYDDKRRMEDILRQAKLKSGYVVVRPSVLSNGPSQGIGSIRQGTTEEPSVGYGISRDDVGLWMFQKIIEASSRDDLKNKGITITC